MNPVATQFGKNLLRYRAKAGISQEALGFRASLHRTEVGLLERGERLPRIDTMLKLAGGLGLPPARLLEDIAWNAGEVTAGRFAVTGDQGYD